MNKNKYFMKMPSSGTKKTNANNGYNSLWRNFSLKIPIFQQTLGSRGVVLADNSTTKPEPNRYLQAKKP